MSNNPALSVVQEISSKLSILGVAEGDPSRVRPFRPKAPSNLKFPIVPVKANHFPVTIVANAFPQKLYHYDVVISPKEMRGAAGRGGVAAEDPEESTVPDRLLHVIWRAFEEKFHRKLGARMPFDGKKNCYSAKPLNFGNNTAWCDEISMVDPDDDDKRRCYRIQLKLANEIKTEGMFEYLKSCETWKYCELPQEVIQALDVALRYCPSLNYQPCNRSFYSSTGPHNISDLLELWFGHNQSLLLGRDKKATLNVDMANKAFLKRLPVSRVMRIQLNIREDYDMKFDRWRPALLREAENFLKGKLIEYGTGKVVQGVPEKNHRFVAVRVMEHSSRTYEFVMNGEKINIQAYFEREKGIKLQYPDWPVVHVGNKNMTNYVPMELCFIVPQAYKGKLEAKDTSEMIKGAAKPPIDRFRRIKTSRDNSKYEKCPILKEFGLSVGSDMIDILTAKRIPKPQLQLRNEKGNEEIQEPKGNDGKFQIGKFLTPAEVPKVGVLNVCGKLTDQYRDTIKKELLTKLGFEAKKLGMVTPNGPRGREPVDRVFINAEYVAVKPRIIRGGNNSQVPFHTATREALKDFKAKGVGLVMVIMGKDGNEYPTVKNEAEVQVGILTQCLKENTVNKITSGSGAKQVLINILLKINAKLGGVNFQLSRPIMDKFQFFKRPTLFLGADVTHPAPHSKSPSVAAITASYDLTGVCFQMHIQVQEAAEEVIHKLSHIIRDMLRNFRAKTKFAPDRIIMFRDGVSEGQFPMIKEQEYRQGILEACRSLSEQYQPRITFLVVKKRHHTRFLPLHQKDSVPPKQNIPPGTVVDTVITHPTEMEFFLNSHVGIQGTSKPTRYHVIHDDNNYSMEELEYLTYCLCYTFVRCTQPVSYPAPTYYAHLAAFRARALLEKEGDNADLQTLAARMTVHKDLKDKYPMFYV